MQAKIFLSSFLATLLAVGVIATPTGAVARAVGSSHSLNGAITPLGEVATAGGVTKPRPDGVVITPKDGDVPVASTSVEARDLVSSKLSSVDWAWRTVTNFHNRRVLQRELLGVST